MATITKNVQVAECDACETTHPYGKGGELPKGIVGQVVVDLVDGIPVLSPFYACRIGHIKLAVQAAIDAGPQVGQLAESPNGVTPPVTPDGRQASVAALEAAQAGKTAAK